MHPQDRHNQHNWNETLRSDYGGAAEYSGRRAPTSEVPDDGGALPAMTGAPRMPESAREHAVAVRTVDGWVTVQHARRLAWRMYVAGFFLLPWAWFVNVWLFRPHCDLGVVRGLKRTQQHGDQWRRQQQQHGNEPGHPDPVVRKCSFHCCQNHICMCVCGSVGWWGNVFLLPIFFFLLSLVG